MLILKKFIQGLSGELDTAIPTLIKSKGISDFISAYDFTIQYYPDSEFQELMQKNWQKLKITAASYSFNGGFATTLDRRLLISQNQFNRFDQVHKALHSKITRSF